MTHDEILDELAKRGLVDGNIVERLSAAHRRELENQHPYADLGCAGVATVHRYEVRATVAGRCDLMATFTDPKRAMEYAEHLALELNEFYCGGAEDGE